MTPTNVRRALALTVSAVLGLSFATVAIPAAAVPGGSVAGTITATSSGEPIAGLVVSVVDDGVTLTDTTDSSGAFSFDGLLDPQVPIAGGGPGTGWRPFTDTVDVPNSAFAVSLRVLPVGPGSVSGVVYDRTTLTPLVGASVNINPNPMMGLGTYDLPATTDSSGRYEFTHIPLGNYSVSVSAPGYESVYPAVSIGSATPKTRDIYLKLTPTGTASISGVFSDSDGPIDGLQVTANRAGSTSGSAYTTTNNDGEYTLSNLPAGRYTVGFDTFSNPQYQRLAYGSNVVLVDTDSSVVENVDFELARYLTGDGAVRGVLTDSRTGAPIPGASVTVRPDSDDRRESFTTTDSDGVWSVTSLAYGTYYVSIQPSFFGPLFEASFDAAPLVISSATRVDRTDSLASLAPGSSVLTGQVRDATTHLGIEGAEVTLSRNLGGIYIDPVVTDSTGHYTFTDLPNGSYAAEVSATGYERVAFDADVASGSQTVNVRLRPAAVIPTGDGTITGVVVDEVGQPVQGAMLVAGAADASTTGEWTSAMSDSDGEFELGGLPLTDVMVNVSVSGLSGGFAPYSRTVSLSSGTTTEALRVELEPEATISGVVSTTTGFPSGVRAAALDVNGLEVGSGRVDGGDGTYTIEGLGTGDYYVLFTATTGSRADGEAITYAPAFWKTGTTGVPYLADATLISLTSGDALDGRDATLTQSGGITGSVKVDAAGDAVVLPPGKIVTIAVYQKQGTEWEHISYADALASQFADGAYTVAGLGAGEYRLKFSDIWTGNRALKTAYNGGAETLEGAASLTVTPGVVTDAGEVALAPAQPSGAATEILLTDLDPDLVDGLEGLIDTDEEQTQGDTMTIYVGEEYAGEWVTTWANSDPTLVSTWTQVAADGTISARVPSTIVGSHSIIVQDADELMLGWTGVTIEASSGSSGTGGTGSGGTTPPRASASGPRSGAPLTTVQPATPAPTLTPTPSPKPTTEADAPETTEPTAEPQADPSSSARPVDTLLMLALVLGGVLLLAVGGAVIWRVRRP